MAPATNGKGSRGLRYMKQDGGGAPVCAGSGDIRPTNSAKTTKCQKTEIGTKELQKKEQTTQPPCPSHQVPDDPFETLKVKP